MLAIIIELGWPVWPLILASVLALALIIERAVALRRPRVLPSGLLDDVLGLVRKQPVSREIVSKLEQNSPLGKVLGAALRNDRSLREGAIQQVEAAGATVANRLTKNLTLLGSIGSIAPLLGLFGTVIGMIHIFASQQAGSSPQELGARHLSRVVLHRVRHHRRGAGRAGAPLLPPAGRGLSGRHGGAG